MPNTLKRVQQTLPMKDSPTPNTQVDVQAEKYCPISTSQTQAGPSSGIPLIPLWSQSPKTHD